MPSFLTDFDAAGTLAYPVNPQVSVPFRPDEYAFDNESTDTDVFLSFDGVNDHVWLRQGGPLQVQGYESIQREVWYRTGPLGVSGTAHVILEAASDD
jgi:hypothetical protein